MQNKNNDKLLNLLETLTVREEDILMRRFANETLQRIAIDYGVSKERIRQLEAKGLKKLWHPTRRTLWKMG